MWLSFIWLALAIALLADHPSHPITSLGALNIFLIHRLLEQKYCRKRNKKS